MVSSSEWSCGFMGGLLRSIWGSFRGTSVLAARDSGNVGSSRRYGLGDGLSSVSPCESRDEEDAGGSSDATSCTEWV